MTQNSKSQIPNALWLAWGTVLFWTGFFHHQPFWGILWSWLCSFFILNIFSLRIERHRGSEVAIWLLLLGLAYPTIVQTDFHKLLREQSVAGMGNRFLDKVSLEGLPSVFPRTIVEGLPQNFYIYAPGTEKLSLTLGTHTHEATLLGHGLFKVQSAAARYNIQGEKTLVTVKTDGNITTREMDYVKALPHPNQACKGRDSRAYVLSEDTDEIYVIGETGIVQKLATGNGPSACLVSKNRLIVSHVFESKLWVFNTQTLERIQVLPMGSPQKSLAQSIDGKTIALALTGSQPSLALLSAENLEPIISIPLPHIPEWVVPGPTDELWNISSRRHPAIIQAKRQDGQWQTTIRKLSRPLISMISSTTGNHIFATTTGYHADGTPLIGNHFIQDQILKLNAETLDLTARLLTHRRAETPKAPGDFLKWTAGAGPSSIAHMSNGDLLVAFSGTTQWWRVNSDLNGSIQEVPVRQAGLSAPHTAMELNERILLLTSPSEGTLGLYDSMEKTTELYQLGLSDDELQDSYPFARQRREGEKAFYEATRSGRSCQSCHMHSDSDHSAHNIGDQELMPATLSVRGIAGTAPYLRGGVYNQVRELLHVPEELLGGYFFDDPMRASNIEHYVASLAQPAQTGPTTKSDLEREQRGLKAFVKAQCTSCHAFPAFTDLSQHPARRLFPTFPEANLELDTPSLIGLKASGPYLFDGRATKISDVFEHHYEGSQHGELTVLNPEEKNDLYYFLGSL